MKSPAMERQIEIFLTSKEEGSKRRDKDQWQGGKNFECFLCVTTVRPNLHFMLGPSRLRVDQRRVWLTFRANHLKGSDSVFQQLPVDTASAGGEIQCPLPLSSWDFVQWGLQAATIAVSSYGKLPRKFPCSYSLTVALTFFSFCLL